MACRGSPFAAQGGAILAPAGALERWRYFRNSLAAGNTIRRDIVCFGDSTTFGSGGLYSYCQRLRDDATGVTTGGPPGIGLADGGKGIIAGGEAFSIIYDAPEVNSYVATTFGVGFPDGFDNLVGQYFGDFTDIPGDTLAMQFWATGCRLWYSQRANAGDFTYSIDGGAPVTVAANGSGPGSRFVYISGLSLSVHTILITNLAVNPAGGDCYIALAPINDAGFAIQKQATSGATITGFFYGGLATTPTQSQNGMRYQTALGLTPTTVSAPVYGGAPFDLTYAAAARVAPVLAMTDLGFNDLGLADGLAIGYWQEYVKRFAGACSDAHCDGIIISGQLPLNVNWPTFGAERFIALRDGALAAGLGFVDLFYPIGGPSLSYTGPSGNPHLTKAQYQAQADFLWNNLLAVV